MKVSKSDRSLVVVILAVIGAALVALRVLAWLNPDELRAFAVRTGAVTAEEAKSMTVTEIYSAMVSHVWSTAGKIVAALLTWRALGPLVGGTLGIASGVGMVGYAALAVAALYATGNLDGWADLVRRGLERQPTGLAPGDCSAGTMAGGVCLELEY